MSFPEEGTRAEFKRAVLDEIIQGTCADCQCLFILVDKNDYINMRCRACEAHYLYLSYVPLIVGGLNIAMMGNY